MLLFRKKNLPLKAWAAIGIIVLIDFQQFPVLRIGGSFKLYELLALLLLIIDLLFIHRLKLAGPVALIAFGFFIISPIISYCYSNLILSYPSGYYLKYPEAASYFKFNYYAFPLLLMVYMFFNFSAFNEIALSSHVYVKLNKILKVSVVIATCIAVYSITVMFTGDFILKLPSYIQNKRYYAFRSSGFSQEPSIYVLYQTWICLMLWYGKSLFGKKKWYVFFAINVASLILTFSSSLASLALLCVLNVFIFKSTFKAKVITILSILVLVFVGIWLINYFDLYDIFVYTFTSKVQNFLTAPAYTTDSGSFRSYTSGIGMKIFKDHWLTGVGVGNSIYYMYLYEFKMGILVFGETLHPGALPQSLPPTILSEQGIIGGALFIGLLAYSFSLFWRYRNASDYNKMFLNGFLFNASVMISVFPTYSMFIWVFIALGINYIRHFNKGVSIKL